MTGTLSDPQYFKAIFMFKYHKIFMIFNKRHSKKKHQTGPRKMRKQGLVVK